MSLSGLVSLVKTECSGKFFFAYVCAPKYACSSANSFLSAQAGLSAHGSGARALHAATAQRLLSVRQVSTAACAHRRHYAAPLDADDSGSLHCRTCGIAHLGDENASFRGTGNNLFCRKF